MMKKYILSAILCGIVSIPCLAQQWTGTWATATETPFGKNDVPQKVSLSNNTLRQIVHVSLGGDVLRIELSNAFGDEPLDIKSVYIADAAVGEQIDAKTAQYLKFNGKQSVTIAPHQVVFSDALEYRLKPLQCLSVTIHYGGSMPKTITTHRGSRTNSYIMVGECKPKQVFSVGEKLEHWYTIAAIDVQAEGKECIAVLGNSITDGRGSTTDQQNRWTDVLAETLGGNYGVLNLGIGGNCVLQGGLGQPAVDRFERDILGQRGVTTLVIYEGINDIGGSKQVEKTGRQLIRSYEKFIKKAREAGMKVYLGTITQLGNTGYWSYYHEACRQTVNEWIRANKEVDGIIDFDQLTRDPQQPTQMRPEWQSDWLHPNAEGYLHMGRYAAEMIQKAAE
ncbi:MAG: SGNH/GDSL hydrolase family protein [Prevotella sp.]|nr:SGNH/GDSL hydrolase family protein [Prevotella sp.]